MKDVVIGIVSKETKINKMFNKANIIFTAYINIQI